MTTITLPDDIEAWAREEVAAGRAESAADAVAEAVRAQRALFDRHKPLLDAAYADIARGDVIDGDEVEAELKRWIAEDLAASR